MIEISASILSIKNENAIKTLYNLETAGIDYFHIDVMDGRFVNKNTISVMQEYCEYLNSISNLPLDVHLMVEDVKSHIDSYLVFEPNIITFHYEAAKNKEQIMEWINYLKENNVKVGISIKPSTKIEVLYDYLPYIHNVLIMTVEPGEGGQKLMEETITKIQNLRKYIDNNGLEVEIEADGGINAENVNLVKKAGANIIVSGTGITNKENYAEAVKDLKK